MEEQYVLDRAELRRLLQEQPTWTRSELAEAVGRSVSWVKKWVKRLRAAPPDNEQVLRGLSRARHHPPERVHPQVVARVLELRAYPPDNLKRAPGARTILYWLERDERLRASGLRVPKSAPVIWGILSQHGCIAHTPHPEHEPLPRSAPMVDWGADFKIKLGPADAEGQQRHLLETLDVIDHGTSILLDNPAREDFTMKTAILALAETLLVHGLPQSLTFDRDPRFVGSWSGDDFPSVFVRFLLCLGIRPNICPPRRPDRNPFVERYHRTYEYECLRVYHPRDLAEMREVNLAFRQHYNFERPNQAITCGNQPPCLAHASLPLLPRVPDIIDPDGWLKTYHHRSFKRRVNPNGSVSLGNQPYYVGRHFKGRHVLLQVDATTRQLQVFLDHRLIKCHDIKGLYGRLLAFQDYLALVCREADYEWQRWIYQSRRRQGTM